MKRKIKIMEDKFGTVLRVDRKSDKVKESLELTRDVIIDIDKDNNILGVEVIK